MLRIYSDIQLMQDDMRELAATIAIYDADRAEHLERTARQPVAELRRLGSGEPQPPPTATTPTKTPAPPPRMLDEVLEVWLGLDHPSPGRVLSNWSPDAPGAYCPRCGATVGDGERTPTGCASCRGTRGLLDGVVRLGPYAGDLRTWILKIKHDVWPELGHALGQRLGAAVIDRGVTGRVVVVPVPMPAARRVYRGIDHARTIAEGVTAALDTTVRPLLRRRSVAPQAGRPASDRRRYGSRGIRLRRWPSSRLAGGTTVVLVDDVLTTGATVRACGRRLRRAGARRVIAAVLAVADDPWRRSREAR